MNSDADRVMARRAALRAALREGNALLAARAAARLRVDGFGLTASEFAQAREARRVLGLSLVKARRPKHPPTAAESAPLMRARTSRRPILAAVTAVLALVLLLLFTGDPGPQAAGGGAPAAPVSVARPTLTTISRGRTISLPLELVAVEESPTPAPTAAPSASAAPTASAPAPSGSGSGGTSSGGTGTGSGSGSGAGSGTAPPTPIATPAPTATPPAPAAGFTRLNVYVFDATSVKPLEGVCVVIGTLNCGPNAPHTDATGRWSADVAASDASTKWTMAFVKSGYVTQQVNITLPGGTSRTYFIYLRRQR